MPEISIRAETIFNLFDVQITNSLILSIGVFIIFTVGGVAYSRSAQSIKKNKFYYFVNFILKALYQLFASAMKEKTDYFFPLLASFFVYILLQNWFGLLPGVGSILINHTPLLRGNNADLNATLSLAMLSVLITQIYGIRYLGLKTYLIKFINFKNPIAFFTGILELISEFSKVISFSFRLFGNIFAGEVLLTIMAFLVPILVSFPFLLLEVFVGFIQALVFSMLSTVFLSLAISKEH